MYKDYYHILELNRSATQAEIRQQWRLLARRYHPDHNPDDLTAEDRFKEILEAYRILSDVSLRIRYDAGLLDRQHTQPEPAHYFYVTCSDNRIACFDEIHLTYTYSGNGRTLIKPDLKDFFVTGSPFVAHRSVLLHGKVVKETHLTYIICPMRTGMLTIGEASIQIEGKRFVSAPLNIDVTENECFFIRNHKADGKPFQLTMHYEFLPGEKPFRVSEKKKNHVLLVPRSKNASLFHNTGSLLKGLCSFYGLIMFSQYLNFNYYLGALFGNILGGVLCTLMYKFTSIRSKYTAYTRYMQVGEYRDRGYELGESSGFPFKTGDTLYLMVRLLL